MVETETTVQRYERYKESGISWLEQIPEHWELKRFKHIFKEKKITHNVELNCGSISFGKVVYKDDEKIPVSTKKSYQVLNKGEFLINPLNLNYDLKSLRIGLSDKDVVVSSGYIIVQNTTEIYKDYYKWLLHIFDVAFMKTLGSGVRQTLSFTHIANSELVFPPLPEQTKIAQFLDDKTTKIDEAIAIKAQQINLLKERKQILIHKAVTRGLDDSVTLKDSGVEWIGEIPEHWEVKRLKHCLNINNGSDYKHIQTDEGYPVIGSGGQFAYASDYMYDGEVVLLGRKGTIDKPLYFKGKFWAVDTMFYANAINGNIVKYLYYLATTLPFSYYSTATALPSMTQGDLNNHPISRPPIDEQNKIVDFIENGTQKIETAIGLKQQEIAKLKEYKSSLINGVVTGKVRVY
ncbi:restriction endonuclease subunit S [Lacinutrix venerupis]|uniref:Type I restriction modification DNA specificity domain-containing protein n=1 Tax=Lacinutrix venerupis TaxID=1486034 RepID=A0AAC9PW79_9FLAO|nr:restriction endonuclease subunit S [Lacinutrix venerupis]APY00547.1 hypothetical protein BWR22_09520 [Lacinutrix venerupis]